MTDKVVVYARVSTTRQADHDLSIPDQIAHADRYCVERDLTVVARYIDPGASARDDARPEFQRMIGDIKSGAVVAHALLVHSFSRFFRETFGFAFYERELARYGVRVVSMTQDVGADSNGALMRTMLSAFDEYASHETAKHVRRSMLENARRGYWNGAKPPFGYRTIVAARHGAKDKKVLEVEPREADIVRLTFQLYLHGDGETGPLGVKGTTTWLNAHGRTHRGGRPFRLQTVHQMLTRASYLGVHHFNRRDSRAKRPRAREEWIGVTIPRLVDDDVFHAVRAQLAARHPRRMAPRITQSAILLSGVARCGCCGSSMRTRTGKGGRYWYYVCARKADVAAKACAGAAIPMRTLDNLVTDAICERVLEPGRLAIMLGALIARSAQHQDGARAELRDLLSEQRTINRQVSQLLDAIERGGDGLRVLLDRLSKRQDELEALNRLISVKKRALECPIEAVSPERIAAFASALRAKLRDPVNPAFRKAYLRLMLDAVIVERDAIRISGPKAELAHQMTTPDPLPPSLVPTFVQGWRTRQDSNL